MSLSGGVGCPLLEHLVWSSNVGILLIPLGKAINFLGVSFHIANWDNMLFAWEGIFQIIILNGRARVCRRNTLCAGRVFNWSTRNEIIGIPRCVISYVFCMLSQSRIEIFLLPWHLSVLSVISLLICRWRMLRRQSIDIVLLIRSFFGTGRYLVVWGRLCLRHLI